jgi:hypothetical protein
VRGSVLKNSPPYCTITTCKIKIRIAIKIKALFFNKPENADLLVPEALTLKRFQNCMSTNVVKNIDISCELSPAKSLTQVVKQSFNPDSPSEYLKKNIINPITKTIKVPPWIRILLNIFLVMMKSFIPLGFFFRTALSDGSVAKANAAKVSIIKLTHNICVTVNGKEIPINGPIKAVISATTFIVSWN